MVVEFGWVVMVVGGNEAGWPVLYTKIHAPATAMSMLRKGKLPLSATIHPYPNR